MEVEEVASATPGSSEMDESPASSSGSSSDSVLDVVLTPANRPEKENRGTVQTARNSSSAFLFLHY